MSSLVSAHMNPTVAGSGCAESSVEGSFRERKSREESCRRQEKSRRESCERKGKGREVQGTPPCGCLCDRERGVVEVLEYIDCTQEQHLCITINLACAQQYFSLARIFVSILARVLQQENSEEAQKKKAEDAKKKEEADKKKVGSIILKVVVVIAHRSLTMYVD